MAYQALTSPASIGRVLDNGFKLFVDSLKGVLLLLVATAIISVLMQYAMFQAMLPAQQYTTEEEAAQYFASAWPQFVVVGLIMYAVTITMYNAILSRIGSVAGGREEELLDSLVTGLRKMLPVLLAGILYVIAVSVGMVLLLIPGLILMLTLIFFQVLIVVDDEGILASLKKSHRLVWGNYWRTTAVILIPFFIAYALIILVAFVMGFIFAFSQPQMTGEQFTPGFGVMDIVLAFVSVLFVPLFYSIFIAQVNDLKLRKSGSDLEQRLAG